MNDESKNIHGDGNEEESDLVDEFQGHFMAHQHADDHICVMAAVTEATGAISSTAQLAFNFGPILFQVFAGSDADRGQQINKAATVMATLLLACGPFVDSMTLISMALAGASYLSDGLEGKTVEEVYKKLALGLARMGDGVFIEVENGNVTGTGKVSDIPEQPTSKETDRMDVFEQFMSTINTDLDGGEA